MKYLSVIGTSKIIHQHLDSAIKLGFIPKDICTTNKNSKNLKKLKVKYKFKEVYLSWIKMFKQHSNKPNRNMHYLIAPRIIDTEKILSKFITLNNKILVEKPVILNSKKILKYLNFNKNIYVGYNRIFYKSINYLKRKKIRNSYINVFIPETKLVNFKKNSCHILSILLFLFGELKVISKIKKKNFILVTLKDKNKNFISINVSFKSTDNFSITFYNKNNTHILKPIEKYEYFKGMKIKKIANDTIYYPKKIWTKSEYDYTKFKPGFYNMWKSFFKSSKKQHPNNISFAYKIMKICEEITV